MEFGFHPDPAIDFVCEVDAIEAEIADRAAGYTEGSDLCARIERAMQFKVGGDPRAVVAKADLRRMEIAFKAGAATTKQEEGSSMDADRGGEPSAAEGKAAP